MVFTGYSSGSNEGICGIILISQKNHFDSLFFSLKKCRLRETLTIELNWATFNDSKAEMFDINVDIKAH